MSPFLVLALVYVRQIKEGFCSFYRETAYASTKHFPVLGFTLSSFLTVSSLIVFEGQTFDLER